MRNHKNDLPVDFEQACLLRNLISEHMSSLNRLVVRHQNLAISHHRDDVVYYESVLANLQFQLALFQTLYDDLTVIIGREMLARKMVLDSPVSSAPAIL